MLKYYFFRLAGWICPRLPAGFGYWLFARFADAWFFFGAQKQRTYFSNLRRVLGDAATNAEINATARRAFQNLLKNYFDLFRARELTPEKIRAQLAGVEGLDHLENAMKQGKGVILGSAHFGTFDMILHLTTTHLGMPIVVPNERLEPEKLFEYVLASRRSQGMEMVALDVAPRALIKALRNGQPIGLPLDRDQSKTGPLVNFFGAPTQMPAGISQLALKIGAPVVVGFSVRQPDNRSFVYIEPPLEFERTGDAARDIRAGTQKLVAVLERYIRQYPDQWLMFQKVW